MNAFVRTCWPVLCCLFLGACGETVADINRNLDRRATSVQIGRDYASLVAPRPALPLAVAAEPMFGDPIGSSDLPDGNRLHRHLTRSIGETSTIDFGIVSTERQRAAYRLVYFKVDGNGTIVDTATGYLRGEATRCVGFVGGIVRRCEDPAALAADLAFLDEQVTTSDGRPLSVWFE